MSPTRYLTAAAAAEELGISLPTLYAYVSRGLIRSEASGQNRRDRRYRRDDVDHLRARQEQRRNPGRVAEQALSWGLPVLESSLSLIADGRLYYRGQDAIALAANSTFEQVAELLWAGAASTSATGLAGAMAVGHDALRAYQPWLGLLSKAAPVEVFQAVLPIAALRDVAAYDLRPAAVAQTGARIVGLLTAAATYPVAPASGRMAERLARGWLPKTTSRPRQDRAVRLIDGALILCADHELNASAFTARCVASARATPYQAVIAGLAALQGLRHGGHLARVEAVLDEIGAPADAGAATGAWLKRGDGLPGFGHPLYPEGDPRARALLEMTRLALPRSRELAVAQAIIREAQALVGEHPTIDFALVVAARALGLPRGAALALFALGRTAGWIGHGMEQYQTEPMIRPRARYIGQMPD